MKKINYFFALCFCTALILTSCGGGDCPKAEGGGVSKEDSAKAATEKANIDGYNKGINAFLKGDKETLKATVAADYVDHNPDPMAKPGLEGMLETMDMLHSMQTNMTFTPGHMLADGDLVFAWGKMGGTMTQDWPAMDGRPAMKCKGKTYSMDFAEIVRVKDGKMVERWGLMDMYGMMAQLAK